MGVQHQEMGGNGVPVSISVSMAVGDEVDERIDPSLRTVLPHNHSQNQNGSGRYTNDNQSPTTPTHYATKNSPRIGKGAEEEEGRRREERREELRREMERIREELRGKEREFEELGG